MKNDEKSSFEQLEYILKNSGYIINICEAEQCGGTAWFESNYDIDINLFEKFKKDPEKIKDLIKEDRNLLIKDYKRTELYKVLNHWIGNNLIINAIFYDIKKILLNFNYNVYLYQDRLLKRDDIYSEIYDSTSLLSYVIIFESNDSVVSMGMYWSD